MRAALSRTTRVRLGTLALATVSVAILIGTGCRLRWNANTEFYRRFVPDAIGVTSMLSQASNASWFDIRPEPCGGFTFRLSDAMLAELPAGGIDRLKGATAARAPELSEFKYSPWRPTPVPSSWVSEGLWQGLGCLQQNDRSIDADSIVNAAKGPGSYFSEGSRTEIIVIPRLKLLVYTYAF